MRTKEQLYGGAFLLASLPLNLSAIHTARGQTKQDTVWDPFLDKSRPQGTTSSGEARSASPVSTLHRPVALVPAFHFDCLASRRPCELRAPPLLQRQPISIPQGLFVPPPSTRLGISEEQ